MNWSVNMFCHSMDLKHIEEFLSFQITYAPWPSSPYHDNFYDDYISGRPYERHYTFVRDKFLSNTSTEVRHADIAHISQNFLGIHIYLDQHLMMEYEVIPKLKFAAFLSQLGGTLNLWAGITIVVVIEFVELVFRVLSDCKSSRPEA